MRVGSHVDHAGGSRGKQTVAQTAGQNEIGHMIGGEGKLQTVGGDLASAEKRARIVEQYIDARLRGGDFSGHALYFRHAREISVINAMVYPARERLQARKLGFAARL